VVRAAGEQHEQAERELADAAQTVEDLEHQLDGVKGELAARMASEQHTAELKQLRDELAKAQARGEEAARMRGELDTLRAQNDALLAALKPAKPSKPSGKGGATST